MSIIMILVSCKDNYKKSKIIAMPNNLSLYVRITFACVFSYILFSLNLVFSEF